MTEADTTGLRPPWYAEPGDDGYRATFYRPEPPYEERHVRVTATPLAMDRLQEMMASAVSRELERGFLPFSDLPDAAKHHYAEAHATWLAAEILAYLHGERD